MLGRGSKKRLDRACQKICFGYGRARNQTFLCCHADAASFPHPPPGERPCLLLALWVSGLPGLFLFLAWVMVADTASTAAVKTHHEPFAPPPLCLTFLSFLPPLLCLSFFFLASLFFFSSSFSWRWVACSALGCLVLARGLGGPLLLLSRFLEVRSGVTAPYST